MHLSFIVAAIIKRYRACLDVKRGKEGQGIKARQASSV
jgi:hypothetical protein